MMDLFADTSGGANILKVRGTALAAMLKGNDPGPVTFSLDNGVKDLHTMLAEGNSLGIELPLTEKTLACFEEASRRGLGATEGAGLSVYWSKRKTG
jgi:3-hydroxyisobutyrate dehydrogenase